MKHNFLTFRFFIFILSSLIIFSGFSCKESSKNTAKKGEAPWSFLRRSMVKQQIKARGIMDSRVLKAMESVPRHLFVPKGKYRNHAYGDFPLPIGHEQTISQPYIVALMTELLQVESEDRILEVGTGSGYQAAVLAEIAKEVYTIEILAPLAQRAEKTLKDMGYKNIHVKTGDGYLGWEEHAPYQGIIVTCAPDHIPKPLLDQLAEGGRLVIPVGIGFQKLKVITRQGRELVEHDTIDCRFVPMLGDEVKEKRPGTRK